MRAQVPPAASVSDRTALAILCIKYIEDEAGLHRRLLKYSRLFHRSVLLGAGDRLDAPVDCGGALHRKPEYYLRRMEEIVSRIDAMYREMGAEILHYLGGREIVVSDILLTAQVQLRIH